MKRGLKEKREDGEKMETECEKVISTHRRKWEGIQEQNKMWERVFNKL